ncbi:MAG TPA: hypothetical protein PK299_06400 [Anaerolineales bacterium]|nr:hypothetical protein [Anaerolineales bacterium]
MNESIPDTQSYLILWFVIFAVFMLGWFASLWSRWQTLQKEEALLDEIAKQAKQ